MDPTIAGLRQKIDRMDRQILELLGKRLQLVLEVGDFKRRHGLPAHDPAREARMLTSLAENAAPPLDASCAERIFARIIEECRGLEQRHIDEASNP